MSKNIGISVISQKTKKTKRSRATKTPSSAPSMMRINGWKMWPFFASHSTSIETGMSIAVSQTIGNDSASTPTTQRTPISSSRTTGVFWKTYWPCRMLSQSIAPIWPRKSIVVIANMARARPIESGRAMRCMYSAMLVGRTCGRISSAIPRAIGASVMKVSGSAVIKRSPPRSRQKCSGRRWLP